MKRCVFGDRFSRIRVDGRPNREKKLKRIRVDRALVVPYRNIMLMSPFWRENNFFVFVSFVYFSFSLELPHTTTTKITLASKYSRLSLNGHLYKTDISVKRTPRVGPCLSFLPLFDSLRDGHFSKTESQCRSQRCPS